MKTTTMKKMLSLFLAVLMIALAIPFTLLTVSAEDGLIKSASITLTSGITNDASERAYGSIAGMIDGDVDGPGGERYYQSKHIAADAKYYSLVNGKFVRDTSAVHDYYGYATFELTSEVALESMTIWLAGDNANQWKKPENNWGINDAYDILYSADGETWTAVEGASFEGMCGVKNGNSSSLGAGFPEKGSYGYHELTHHGYTHVGHRIALNGIEAKYIAIAISGLDHSGSPTVVIGDVTVEEHVQEPSFGEEVVDGELIKTVDFSDSEMWGTEYGSSTFDDASWEILDDGASAKITLKNEGNKRVLWGGLQGEHDIEWTNADKRTVVFKSKFGNENFYFGIQMDWDNALTIKGNGWVEWYNYASAKHASTVNAERWNYVTDVAQADEQTFAVEVDYSANTMTLFVMNKDGSFGKVVTKTWADAGWNTKTESQKMGCRFFAISTSGKADASYYVEVSDLRIYDGLIFTSAPAQPVLPDSYADVADGGLIYNVNFNGTADFWTPQVGWRGMKAAASEDGSSVALTPYSSETEAGVWGAELPAESDKNADGKFRMLQSAYTVVCTLSAENANQEMGIFLDWATGFAITPGNNSFRYVKGKQAETVFTGTYEGTKSLTQTYAIEIKDEGTATNINDHSTFSYNCTVYNLYVVQNGEWVKIFSLDTSSNATALKNALNWGSGDWEFVLRMFRDGLDENQINAMTISDMSVYKGLAIAEHDLVVPELPENKAPIYVQKSLDGTKIRFIGVVNLSEEEFENFSELGFDITMTYNGKKYMNTYTTTTVYTSLMANGTTVYASEYGGTYFYAIEITGLDAATSDVVFDVDGFTVNSGETTKNGFGGARVTFTPAS